MQILMRFRHNTCLFFDPTKGDIYDVVIYIIARTNVFWGITGQAKISNTHAFFHDFWCVYNMTFVFFFSTQNVLCWRQCYIHNHVDEVPTVFFPQSMPPCTGFFHPPFTTPLGWCHEWMFYGVKEKTCVMSKSPLDLHKVMYVTNL